MSQHAAARTTSRTWTTRPRGADLTGARPGPSRLAPARPGSLTRRVGLTTLGRLFVGAKPGAALWGEDCHGPVSTEPRLRSADRHGPGSERLAAPRGRRPRP